MLNSPRKWKLIKFGLKPNQGFPTQIFLLVWKRTPNLADLRPLGPNPDGADTHALTAGLDIGATIVSTGWDIGFTVTIAEAVDRATSTTIPTITNTRIGGFSRSITGIPPIFIIGPITVFSGGIGIITPTSIGGTNPLAVPSARL